MALSSRSRFLEPQRLLCNAKSIRAQNRRLRRLRNQHIHLFADPRVYTGSYADCGSAGPQSENSACCFGCLPGRPAANSRQSNQASRPYQPISPLQTHLLNQSKELVVATQLTPAFFYDRVILYKIICTIRAKGRPKCNAKRTQVDSTCCWTISSDCSVIAKAGAPSISIFQN